MFSLLCVERRAPNPLQLPCGQRIEDADAQRTAAATADVGASILTQLGSQREQLISARSSMQGANQQLADARKNITTMFRRATTKKCIIYGIIIGLCGTIVLVLISKFSRR